MDADVVPPVPGLCRFRSRVETIPFLHQKVF